MIIVWHHLDLRIEDHPAIEYAAKQNLPLCPLYIIDDSPGWKIGSSSRWFLNQSLLDLKQRYKSHGSDLFIGKGPALDYLLQLHKKHPIEEICWLERIEPKARKRDATIEKRLSNMGIAVSIFAADGLADPEELKTKSGTPFKVFTPFYNTLKKGAFSVSKTPALPKPPKLSSSVILKDEKSDPLADFWTPGRKGAEAQLSHFCKSAASHYGKQRDFPALDATSRLSPHLHFGELSLREVWKRTQNSVFHQELGWREFSNYFLYHFPETCDTSYKKEFERFSWKKNPQALRKWKEGKTGFPIVDAGMRQLLEEGWMHNRVRMIVASFLTKDLMIHWKEGAKWFWEHLVDADLASNSMGWQWVSGSGADAAPFFRIFNPILQSQKFDPKGDYIRRYVPQLADLSDKEIHFPSEKVAGYPAPMLDHKEASQKALAAYKRLK